MGAGAFKAETYEPSTTAELVTATTVIKGSSITPNNHTVTRAADTSSVPIDVTPVDSDDAVSSLVKREIANLQVTLNRVNAEIEQLRRRVTEAEARKSALVDHVARYASFLT